MKVSYIEASGVPSASADAMQRVLRAFGFAEAASANEPDAESADGALLLDVEAAGSSGDTRTFDTRQRRSGGGTMVIPNPAIRDWVRFPIAGDTIAHDLLSWLHNRGGVQGAPVGCNAAPAIFAHTYKTRFVRGFNEVGNVVFVLKRFGECETSMVFSDDSWQRFVGALQTYTAEACEEEGVATRLGYLADYEWSTLTPPQRRDMYIALWAARRAHDVDDAHPAPFTNLVAQTRVDFATRERRLQEEGVYYRSLGAQYPLYFGAPPELGTRVVVAVYAVEFVEATKNIEFAIELGTTHGKQATRTVADYESVGDSDLYDRLPRTTQRATVDEINRNIHTSLVMPNERHAIGGLKWWRRHDSVIDELSNFITTRSMTKQADPLALFGVNTYTDAHDPFRWLVIRHYFGVSNDRLHDGITSCEAGADSLVLPCALSAILMAATPLSHFYHYAVYALEYADRRPRCCADLDRRLRRAAVAVAAHYAERASTVVGGTSSTRGAGPAAWLVERPYTTSDVVSAIRSSDDSMWKLPNALIECICATIVGEQERLYGDVYVGPLADFGIYFREFCEKPVAFERSIDTEPERADFAMRSGTTTWCGLISPSAPTLDDGEALASLTSFGGGATRDAARPQARVTVSTNIYYKFVRLTSDAETEFERDVTACRAAAGIH